MDQAKAKAYLQVDCHDASLNAALKGLEGELFPAGNKKPASNGASTPQRVSQ